VQRNYYVTPTSYLELINAFKDVLHSKRGEVLKNKACGAQTWVQGTSLSAHL